LLLVFPGGKAVRALEDGTLPSPSLTKVSTARSRLPLNPLSTVELRFSSGKPMSFNVASFDSNVAPVPPIDAPKILDCLFTRIGEGGPPNPVLPSGDSGGDSRAVLESGNVDDAARRPKPNRLPGLGGSGGGCSSELLVLPVF